MKLVYALSLMILASTFAVTLNKAYGHGLGGDMAVPINFGGQNITIETRIVPEDLALYSIQEGLNPIIKIRFFDFDNDVNIPQVTMFVKIEKDDKTLLGGWFYDPNGEVKIQVNPTNIPNFRIYGEEELQLGGYYNRNGEPVRVDAPIFLEGGLYKISATVKSALTSKQLLDTPITFDTFVSVADDNEFSVVAAGKEYPITVRTYYDKITKLEVEEDVLRFEMPFNWEENYINLVPMVHEEAIIPKDMPIASTGQFIGYVNDVKLDEKRVVVDPYTYTDRLIVHFVLDTNTLQEIRKQMVTDGNMNVMRFRLEKVESTGGEFESVVLTTDNNNAKIIAQWPKQGIFPQQESEIRLSFFTPSNAIIRDVYYTIRFLDEDGNIILEQDRYAPEGIDVIKHTFDREGIVTMQVNIKGTGPMQKLNTNIAGNTETSISVVPEFPIAILVISIAMVSAIVMMRSKNKLLS